MANETVFQAYFETEEYSVFLEYEPGPDGAVFILSIDIQPRPVSLFQQRQRSRRRGIVLSDQEQRAEAMQPYMQIEQGKPRQLELLP